MITIIMVLELKPSRGKGSVGKIDDYQKYSIFTLKEHGKKTHESWVDS
jgi:hypothetical protein